MKKNEAQNKIYLNPGDLVITSKSEIIWTLLGSCISIIFYSPLKKISGVCHAQLPYEKSNLSCKSTCPKPCGKKESDEFKFVTCSFKYMLDTFHEKGISNPEIQVSLFGGSSMFESKNTVFNIGDMNIEKALELINENGLKIVRNETGGNISRSLTHYTDTGITKVKYN
jgi:chemotaxis protein CheD